LEVERMFNPWMDFFPENLVNLSFESIHGLKGEKLEVEGLIRSEETLNLEGETETLNLKTFKKEDLEKRVFEISPLNDYVTVVGVDISLRKIGNTKNGVVCAFRGTVVWKDEYAYHYTRYGPLLYHLTENHAKTVFGLKFDGGNPNHNLGKIQFFVEKVFQKHVLRNLKNSIVLFDGCLSTQMVNVETLNLARKNNNRVLAFAKKSRLYSWSEPLKVLREKFSPCILCLNDLLSESFKSTCLGWVFLAKLSKENFLFRLDVDKTLALDEAVQTVRRLIGNEHFHHGYPETLRIAHSLSILTRVEVIAIQRFLTEKLGIKILRPENHRRMLFGPFGGW